jgi:gliding motility associated protien GldN
MKLIRFIGLIFLLVAFAGESFSQNPQPQTRTRQRPGETPADNMPALSERAKIKNAENSKGPAHVVWLREMYSYIDLTKDENAALYYPPRPVGDRKNLFTVIFQLVADGKLVAYNFNDTETFTEAEKVDFEEILKKFQVLYTVQGTGNNKKYIVDNRDIPGSEALKYLIKEGWYFDEATGSFKSQVTAICPILVREDDYGGGVTNNPLFWIPYENLRPYIAREMIMTSDYNNALTYTIDDYFSKRMYTTDIIKTVNLRDLSLAQQVGDNPEVLKHAQDSIEKQLKTFEKQLWVREDTTLVADKKGQKTVKKSTTKKEETKKEEKSKATKSESAPSAPTRSVRRTR